MPRAENFRELCPAGQLDQRLVTVLIGEIGGVKISGHGQQPPLQAVVLQDAGSFPGGGFALQRSIRHAQAGYAVFGAQRRKHGEGMVQPQHRGVQYGIHIVFSPFSGSVFRRDAQRPAQRAHHVHIANSSYGGRAKRT